MPAILRSFSNELNASAAEWNGRSSISSGVRNNNGFVDFHDKKLQRHQHQPHHHRPHNFHAKKFGGLTHNHNTGRGKNGNNNNKLSIVVPHPEDPSKTAIAYFDGYGYVVNTYCDFNAVLPVRNNSPEEEEEKTDSNNNTSFVPSDASSDEFSSSSSSPSSSDEEEEESFKDAAEKYGYGDASPDERGGGAAEREMLLGISSPQYRRASINRRNRRASNSSSSSLLLDGSIHSINDNHNNHNKNDDTAAGRDRPVFHPQRTPRRSSLKNSSSSSSMLTTSSSRTTKMMYNAFHSSFNDALDLDILKEVDPDSVLEIRLPGRRQSVTRRRSITFNEDVEIQNIRPAKELTDRPDKLWFLDHEYDAIERKNNRLVVATSNGNKNFRQRNPPYDSDNDCVRGLERYLNRFSSSADNLQDATDSVLKEQESQRSEGFFCEESIRNSYKNKSERSATEARRRAEMDANEAIALDYNGGLLMNRATTVAATKVPPGFTTASCGRISQQRRASVA